MSGHWSHIELKEPGSRWGHSMVYDPVREKILMFGGDGEATGDLRQLFEWNGATWTLLADFGPSGRTSHAATFETTRNRMVVFGGRRGKSALTEPWEWDGTGWAKLPDFGPGPRFNLGLVYDTSRKRLVVFGGGAYEDSSSSKTAGYDDRTWEWDGRAWALRAEGGPPGRYGHSMVYDHKRGVTVLFGGAIDLEDPTGELGVVPKSFFGDTWEWDGSVWRQVTDLGPGGRAFHSMAYDDDRGRVVLFGGQFIQNEKSITTQLKADTWEWDGSNWMQVAGAGPGQWIIAAMAYDRARHQMVLFGGLGKGTNKKVWIWNPTS